MEVLVIDAVTGAEIDAHLEHSRTDPADIARIALKQAVESGEDLCSAALIGQPCEPSLERGRAFDGRHLSFIGDNRSKFNGATLATLLTGIRRPSNWQGLASRSSAPRAECDEHP